MRKFIKYQIQKQKLKTNLIKKYGKDRAKTELNIIIEQRKINRRKKHETQ